MAKVLKSTHGVIHVSIHRVNEFIQCPSYSIQLNFIEALYVHTKSAQCPVHIEYSNLPRALYT